SSICPPESGTRAEGLACLHTAVTPPRQYSAMAHRARYVCGECSVPFMVAHEPSPQPPDLTPVGCPRCGAVLFADIPLDVAQGLGYQALPEQVVKQGCNGCART